jgi:hypothetical protein
MTTAAQFNAKMGSFGSLGNFASTEIGFVPSNAIAKGNWLNFKGVYGSGAGSAAQERDETHETNPHERRSNPFCHAA